MQELNRKKLYRIRQNTPSTPTFLDDIAIQAAEEIIAEFGESTSVT